MNCWVIVDGKRRLRVTGPQVHGGSSVPVGTLRDIRNQRRLGQEDFARLIECLMSRADYHEVIRGMVESGLL